MLDCGSPGDAWSGAQENLDKVSYGMAQDAVDEGLNIVRAAAAHGAVPESLSWEVVVALNQVSDLWNVGLTLLRP